MAAGKGTRMKSDLPKVLHRLRGQPLLAYSLELARSLAAAPLVVVVGYQAGQVMAACGQWPELKFVCQEPQLGTGHAVMTAVPELSGLTGSVLILNGDVPGLTLPTVQNMLSRHYRERNALTVLAMELENPAAYGRLITSRHRLLAIREYRDAAPEEQKINLVNAGIYLFAVADLLAALPLLKNNNDQQEYYLTDLVAIMNSKGLPVGYDLCANPWEVAGVNSQDELRQLESLWRKDK
ncbi:MAG: NTP transferase domain-containing protein [Desulfarculales bacterium]|nr:NTP transferase domain-containing protein [Desulfarculales bacterium]